MVITGDGTRLITGSYFENALRIWDANTGQLLSELPDPALPTTIGTVALSPNGRLLTRDGHGELALWNLDTGQITVRFPEAVEYATMSADGGRVAGIRDTPGESSAPQILVWDTTTGRLVNSITDRSAGSEGNASPLSFRSVTLSPDGDRVVTAGTDGAIRVWEVETGQPIGSPFSIDSPGQEQTIRTFHLEPPVAFSPDGQRFAAGFIDGTIRTFDSATTEPVGAPMTGHRDPVGGLTYSPDGKRIASAGFDHTVRVWNTDGNPIGEPLTGHTDKVFTVTFSPDGQRIFSTGADQTIRVWRADADSRLGGPLSAPDNETNPIGITPGAVVDPGARGVRSTAIWNLDDGRVTSLTPFGLNLGGVKAVAATPDGRDPPGPRHRRRGPFLGA